MTRHSLLLLAAITLMGSAPDSSSPARSAAAPAALDGTPTTAVQRCGALTRLNMLGGRVVSAVVIAFPRLADADEVRDNPRTPEAIVDRSFCRVIATLVPAAGASVNFELWLPVGDAWNGKFLGTSTGGLEKIDHSEMAGGLARGYAVAALDLISADIGGPKSYRFAIGRPELAKNYAYRGIHLMTVASKEMLAAFYARQEASSIFAGCSGAGYQAIGEATRYPADYDGVIAGSPLISLANMGLSQGYRYVVSHRSAASAIPATSLPMIASEVLAQCDGLDGLADGIIDDPRRCRVDFRRLICKRGELSGCLLPDQVVTLDAIYAGLRDPRTGALIYPGFQPGAELNGGAKVRIADDSTASFINDETPGPLSWALGADFTAKDWLKFDFGSDGDRARATIASYENGDPNLKAFAARGGKIILYAGWGDANINAMDVVGFYEALVRRAGGREKASAFARLFMAPGMHHCLGGPGPNSFGQRLAHMGAGPEDDLVKALDRWLTKGIAPERIIATKFENDNEAGRIIRSRPLCPFPKMARWSGLGSIDDNATFRCVEP